MNIRIKNVLIRLAIWCPTKCPTCKDSKVSQSIFTKNTSDILYNILLLKKIDFDVCVFFGGDMNMCDNLYVYVDFFQRLFPNKELQIQVDPTKYNPHFDNYKKVKFISYIMVQKSQQLHELKEKIKMQYGKKLILSLNLSQYMTEDISSFIHIFRKKNELDVWRYWEHFWKNISYQKCLLKESFSFSERQLSIEDQSIEIHYNWDLSVHNNVCNRWGHILSNIRKEKNNILNDFMNYDMFLKQQINITDNQYVNCKLCIKNNYEYKK